MLGKAKPSLGTSDTPALRGVRSPGTYYSTQFLIFRTDTPYSVQYVRGLLENVGRIASTFHMSLPLTIPIQVSSLLIVGEPR